MGGRVAAAAVSIQKNRTAVSASHQKVYQNRGPFFGIHRAAFAAASVVAVDENLVAVDESARLPGGGCQCHTTGRVQIPPIQNCVADCWNWKERRSNRLRLPLSPPPVAMLRTVRTVTRKWMTMPVASSLSRMTFDSFDFYSWSKSVVAARLTSVCWWKQLHLLLHPRSHRIRSNRGTRPVQPLACCSYSWWHSAVHFRTDFVRGTGRMMCQQHRPATPMRTIQVLSHRNQPVPMADYWQLAAAAAVGPLSSFLLLRAHVARLSAPVAVAAAARDVLYPVVWQPLGVGELTQAAVAGRATADCWTGPRTSRRQRSSSPAVELEGKRQYLRAAVVVVAAVAAVDVERAIAKVEVRLCLLRQTTLDCFCSWLMAMLMRDAEEAKQGAKFRDRHTATMGTFAAIRRCPPGCCPPPRAAVKNKSLKRNRRRNCIWTQGKRPLRYACMRVARNRSRVLQTPTNNNNINNSSSQNDAHEPFIIYCSRANFVHNWILKKKNSLVKTRPKEISALAVKIEVRLLFYVSITILQCWDWPAMEMGQLKPPIRRRPMMMKWTFTTANGG